MLYFRGRKPRGSLQLEKLMSVGVTLNTEAEFECG